MRQKQENLTHILGVLQALYKQFLLDQREFKVTNIFRGLYYQSLNSIITLTISSLVTFLSVAWKNGHPKNLHV